MDRDKLGDDLKLIMEEEKIKLVNIASTQIIFREDKRVSRND